MSIDVWVPDGSPSVPGFAVQGGPNGLTIGVGRAGQDTSLFGVTNDQNGALVNVYPTAPPVVLTTIYANVEIDSDYSQTLRGPIKLELLAAPGGAVTDTLFNTLEFTWSFTPIATSEIGAVTYRNNISNGRSVFKVNAAGIGYLPAGDYRMSIYWYGYGFSYTVLEVIEFTVPADTNALTLARWRKRTNTTAPEW